MKPRAFTLIELLVVIAIIALLMSILMPALSAVREQGRQQSCASRIRQQVVASIMYAQDNDGTLALPKTPGSWMHDLAVNTVDYMMANGMTREMFYCPSNAVEQKYMNYFWEFTTEWDGARWVNPNDNSFILSSYLYILQTTQGNRPALRNNENKTGPKRWCKTINDKQSATMELCIDAIPSQDKAGAKDGRTFTEVGGGGIWNKYQLYEQANHIKNSDEPRGGNIGFLDGHIEWRRFDDMEDRIGGVTHYWW